MRIARYIAPEASEAAVGIIGDDDIVAEVPASGGDLGPLLLLNKAGLEQVASASMVSHKLSDVRLLAPVGSPGKILALAANYHPHDSDNPVDVDVNIPKFFAKPTTALLGPDATIPFHAKATIHTVEEIELCVVIGRPGKNISREDAFGHVFGYTVINDFSGRDLRLNPSRDATGQGGWFEWLNGKWLDGYAPVGPWIVPAEDVSDVTNLQITTKVNGAVRVDGNSGRMLYDIPRQIAYISLLCTLEPGDLIATGVVPLAPGIDDETYIQAGDVIEGVIEGIGTLRNTLGSA